MELQMGMLGMIMLMIPMVIFLESFLHRKSLLR